MMQTKMIFFYLALVFIAMYIYYTIRIIGELRKRGVKINYLLLRLYIIQYVNQYKKITTEERGYPGEYYRPWIICIVATGVSILLAIVFNVWG